MADNRESDRGATTGPDHPVSQGPVTGPIGLMVHDLYMNADAKSRLPTVTDAATEVIIYARYSTDEQKPSSIQRQVDVCRRYMRTLGIHNYRLVTDIGLSAALIKNRDGLQLVLKDIKADKVRMVFCEAFDRWSRDISDAVHMAEILERHKVDFFCSAEERKMTKAEQTAAAIAAENDRRRRRNLTTAGRYQAALDGAVPNGGLNFGYARTSRPGFPAKIEAEARVVRKLFRLSAAIKSRSKIAARMQADGEVGPGGSTEWNSRMVEAMQKQTMYAALVIYGREETTFDREKGVKKTSVRAAEDVVMVRNERYRIVSDELFVAANRHRRKRTTKRAEAQNYLLSGRVRCDCPGVNLGFYHSEQTLTCGARKEQGKCTGGPSRIRQEAVERAVLTVLGERLLKRVDGQTFAQERERAAAEAAAEREARRVRLDRQIEIRKTSLRRLMESRYRSAYDDDAMVSDYEERLHASLAKLLDQRMAMQGPPRLARPLSDLAGELRRLSEKLPFKVETLADTYLRDAIRRIVKAVVLRIAGQPYGRATASVHLDLDALFFEEDERQPGRAPEVVEVEIDLLRRSTRARIAADELRRTRSHSLTDDQWRVIEPLLPHGLEKVESSYGVTVRDVADDLLAALVTGDRLRRQKDAPGRAMRMLLYRGVGDSLLEGLNRHDPAFASTLHRDVIDVHERRRGLRKCPNALSRFNPERFMLTDAQWETTRAHIHPNVATARHGREVDPRMLLDCVLHKLHLRIAFRKLPPRYGTYEEIFYDVRRLVYAGTWDRLLLVWRDTHPELVEGLGDQARLNQFPRGAEARGWVDTYANSAAAPARRPALSKAA